MSAVWISEDNRVVCRVANGIEGQQRRPPIVYKYDRAAVNQACRYYDDRVAYGTRWACRVEVDRSLSGIEL